MPSVRELEAPGDVTPVKILIIGGSYGGLSVALNLLDLCNGKQARFTASGEETAAAKELQHIVPVEIKIIDERDGFYHLIGSPLALASKTYSEKAWVTFTDIPTLRAPGISFAQGIVASVDLERKIAQVTDVNSGDDFEESYDFLVACSGMRRSWPVVPQSLTKAKYLTEVGAHIDLVKNAREGVVVIGGGACGVEMAAELKLMEPTQKVTLIQSRDKLLSSEPLPDEFKDQCLVTLKETGVGVILGDRVVDIISVKTDDNSQLHKLVLQDGRHIMAGHVINAISHNIPSSTYIPKAQLNSEGFVKVRPTLNFAIDAPNPQHHFAVGDIAAWSGIKRCGGAMAMGLAAATNVHQQLLSERFGKVPKFVQIPEYEAMIALAVGKKAVLYGPEDGVTRGEAEMQMMFQDDLGWTIVWNYLQLEQIVE